MHRELTIGALSERSGVNIETIRYYERADLLPAPPRTQGGHRIYGGDSLKRLVFIRRGRELGFTLDEIRNLLGLMRGGHPAAKCRPWRSRTSSHIRAKIADLRRMERTLAATVARCEGGNAPECPILDALCGGCDDRLSKLRVDLRTAPPRRSA